MCLCVCVCVCVCVRVLLMATTPAQRTHQDSGGITALMRAAMYGDVAMAGVLLAHGADVAVTSVDGFGALALAGGTLSAVAAMPTPQASGTLSHQLLRPALQAGWHALAGSIWPTPQGQWHALCK